MKSFTMIPDGLTIRGTGKNKASTKLMIAYLVRAYGHPGGKRFNDLTIGQLSKFVGIRRESASDLFHHIVDLWEWPFGVIVAQAYGPELDIKGLYQFLLRVQERARLRANARRPKGERTSHNVTVDRHIMGHYKNVRRLRRQTDDVLPSSPIGEREDRRSGLRLVRGETERMDPSEVSTSTSAHDGLREASGSEPTDDSRDDWADWILRTTTRGSGL